MKEKIVIATIHLLNRRWVACTISPEETNYVKIGNSLSIKYIIHNSLKLIFSKNEQGIPLRENEIIVGYLSIDDNGEHYIKFKEKYQDIERNNFKKRRKKAKKEEKIIVNKYLNDILGSNAVIKIDNRQVTKALDIANENKEYWRKINNGWSFKNFVIYCKLNKEKQFTQPFYLKRK